MDLCLREGGWKPEYTEKNPDNHAVRKSVPHIRAENSPPQPGIEPSPSVTWRASSLGHNAPALTHCTTEALPVKVRVFPPHFFHWSCCHFSFFFITELLVSPDLFRRTIVKYFSARKKEKDGQHCVEKSTNSNPWGFLVIFSWSLTSRRHRSVYGNGE